MIVWKQASHGEEQYHLLLMLGYVKGFSMYISCEYKILFYIESGGLFHYHNDVLS